MRDAMGGTVALVIIVVFIVIALGYMAFNVNYTKAFRMKNKIISVYNDYNGNCNSECQGKIKDYASTLGYSLGNSMTCNGSSGYKLDEKGLYCYKKVYVENFGSDADNRSFYYKVITKINVQVPIINNVLDLKVFYITGDTKTFQE